MFSTSPARWFGPIAAIAVASAPQIAAAAGLEGMTDAAEVVGRAREVSALIDASQRFDGLAQRCAPGVDAKLLGRMATVESSGNPYAIGVVGGKLVRQPKNMHEALATAIALDAAGWNYSMGLVQVNVHNLAKYGQMTQSIFDPCTNLRIGAAILRECYGRAIAHSADRDVAVHAALSCYYSGNFSGGVAYARKVAASQPVTTLGAEGAAIPVVPDVRSGVVAAAGAAPAGASASANPPIERPRGLARAASRRAGDDWFTTWSDDEEGEPAKAAGASLQDVPQQREAQ